jgi:glycosyltransferase involved in cell wall biosynthesis
MIISSFDRTFIEHPERDQILIVKNGIDLDFFKADPTIEKTVDLLFVGNLEYPPNILAVNILLEKVMPKLIEKNPHIKLLISGANPQRSWLKHQSPNIQILANPKDIREAYHAAKIFVAPMMLGTGLQNKLLEAMAMKLPCITTPLANTGLQATENKEILIAKTPDEMITHILFLQNNPSVCFQLSEQAFEFVKSFSWEKELEKWM